MTFVILSYAWVRKTTPLVCFGHRGTFVSSDSWKGMTKGYSSDLLERRDLYIQARGGQYVEGNSLYLRRFGSRR